MVARAVFLDRDGVLNANIERDGRPVAPTSLAEFKLLPGVEDATRRLKAAGYLLIVVTNQPDVRTGRTSRATVEAMHAELRRTLPLDDIRVCFHVDADNCECRKPKPGLIVEAAATWNIDCAASFLVGDRWRDIEAGNAAGCSTILIGYSSGSDRPVQPNGVVHSLSEAARFILEHQPQGQNRT